MDKEDLSLTDHEAALLALLARAGPLTGHRVGRIYEKSPVSSISSSKGTIYPMIARLRERGLVEAAPVGSDRRQAEAFVVTAEGKKALKAWVKDTRQTNVLPEDPLRTKLQSFDLLTRDEQIKWIAEIKAQLHDKLADLNRYRHEVTVPYHDLVHEIAVQTVRARLDWLDLVLLRIARDLP